MSYFALKMRVIVAALSVYFFGRREIESIIHTAGCLKAVSKKSPNFGSVVSPFYSDFRARSISRIFYMEWQECSRGATGNQNIQSEIFNKCEKLVYKAM